MRSSRSQGNGNPSGGHPELPVLVTDQQHCRLQILKSLGPAFAEKSADLRCHACGNRTSGLLKVLISNQDFECRVPVVVCETCASQPPFVLKLKDRRLPVAAVLIVAALCLALAGHWIWSGFPVALIAGMFLLVQGPKRISVSVRRAQLDEFFGKVPYLRDLQLLEPDLQFTLPLRSATTLQQESASEIVQSSYIEFEKKRLWVTAPEAARANVNATLLQLLLSTIDTLTASVLHHRKIEDDAAVQIDVVILPGRRLEFKIHAFSTQSAILKDQLTKGLRALPSIPVEWPILVTFLRCRRKALKKLETLGQHYVAREAQNASISLGSYGEYAMKSFKAQPETDFCPITIDDCLAWRKLGNLRDHYVVDLARFLDSQNRLDDAIAMIEEQIRLSPANPYLLMASAQLLYSQHQFERSAVVCQQIIQRFPHYSDAYGLLATLQQEMGRHEDAERTLRSAPTENRSVRFWLTAGRVALALNKLSDAAESADLAMQMEPDNVLVLMLRAEVYVLQQKYAEAVEVIQKVESLAGMSIETTINKVNLLSELRRPEESLVALTAALYWAPGNSLLLSMRARLFISLGKLALAREDCDAMLQVSQNDGLAYEIRALIHLESDDPESALADIERAVDAGHDSSNIEFYRGSARFMLAQYDQAVEDFETACEKSPDHLSARYLLARARAMSGHTDKAIADLNDLLVSVPDWAYARIIRGHLHLGNGDLTLAAEDFDLAIQQMPSLVDAYRGRSIVHRLRGEIRESLALLDQALAIDPEHAACRFDRSQLLMNEHDLNGATRDLDAVLSSIPDLLPALLSRAHLRLQLGQIDDARKDFDAILKDHPEFTPALIGRSVVFDHQGDDDRAQEDLEAATRNSPEDAQATEISYLLIKALLARRNEQYDDAIQIASEIIALDPDHYEALRCRAGSYWYSECFVEALQDYTHLIETHEEADSASFNGRGQVYAELGEYELALKDLEVAVESSRRNPSKSCLPYCLSGLGKTLTGLGRYDEAEAAFEESMQCQPDNAWLHFNRGLLHLARNDHNSAGQCFERSLKLDNPRLSPKKRARAEAFLQKLKQ